MQKFNYILKITENIRKYILGFFYCYSLTFVCASQHNNVVQSPQGEELISQSRAPICCGKWETTVSHVDVMTATNEDVNL